MRIDVDNFDQGQKEFLSALVSDLGGPTMTSALLQVIARVLDETVPDWEIDPQSVSEDLRKDLEVCRAALNFYSVQSLAEAS